MSSLPIQAAGAGGAQSIRRFVNDEISAFAATLTIDESTPFQFLCECGDLRCRETIPLTLPSYRVTSPGSIVAH